LAIVSAQRMKIWWDSD